MSPSLLVTTYSPALVGDISLKQLLNPAHIKRITPRENGVRSLIELADGEKIEVAESFAHMIQMFVLRHQAKTATAEGGAAGAA